jgi:CRP-like cAMP-binding protein
MVSPELLRRFPLFTGLTPRELNAVAMLVEEVDLAAGETVVRSGGPADALYVLREGALELHYLAEDAIHPEHRRELFISEINPGEPFGISALIEPYVYSGSINAREPSVVLRIDGRGLRALCEADPELSRAMLRQVARAALDRLQATEVLLGAAGR